MAELGRQPSQGQGVQTVLCVWVSVVLRGGGWAVNANRVDIGQTWTVYKYFEQFNQGAIE